MSAEALQREARIQRAKRISRKLFDRYMGGTLSLGEYLLRHDSLSPELKLDSSNLSGRRNREGKIENFALMQKENLGGANGNQDSPSDSEL